MNQNSNTPTPADFFARMTKHVAADPTLVQPMNAVALVDGVRRLLRPAARPRVARGAHRQRPGSPIERLISSFMISLVPP